MSARTLRRTFATPFVVTIAACTMQSGPAPSRPMGTAQHPGHGDPAQPGPASSGGLPARPDERAQMGTQGTAQTDTSERRWTVSRQGGTCMAYTKVECPPNAACNPPRPTEYTCTADIAEGTSINIVRVAGSATCMIERPPISCPPNVMCNPPPPQQVACPR